MTIRQLTLFGDSTTQGTQGGFCFSFGGQGSWADLVIEELANISGIGPLVSSGFRGIHLGNISSGYPSEWTQPSSTTATLSTDAWDVYPYGAGTWANGASKIWTWTKPSKLRPIVGFALYYANMTGGGDWQYRIDGGTWTNMGQTLGSNVNKLCKFYISTPIVTTLDIRASSDATTGVNCAPIGIEVFYLDPSTTSQGLIVHNVGVNGVTLNALCASTSGDRLAILDAVKLGTGSPLTTTPNAGVIVMHINDVAFVASTSTWNTDLGTLTTRAQSLGPVAYMNIYECSNFYPFSTQTSYRAQTKTTAAAQSPAVSVLDLYDLYAALGLSSSQNSKLSSGGYLFDLTHESELGHQILASWIYWFVRNQILALGNVPSTYVASAKQPAVQYTGKLPAVQYSAAAPIGVT